MNASKTICLDLPLTDYLSVLKLQYDVLNAKISGNIKQDILILLEHPSVFTLGKRGGLDNFLIDKTFLDQAGVQVVSTERGGNITYHGPGQIVGYPIFHLRNAGLSVVDFVYKLEEVMIRTAADWNIDASRRDLNRGVWVENRKLGSIGITVRRQISFHGFALNIAVDLKPFEWIHPCGLKGISMTSFEKETLKKVDMQSVKKRLKTHLQTIFQLELESMSLDSLWNRIQNDQAVL